MESRDRIGEVLGTEPQGFRAPAFHIDRECLELLAEAGYAYDSSLFPTARFARQIGVERVQDTPHRPLDGYELLELSLPSAAPLPFPFHSCYSLVLGMTYYRLALRRFRRRGVPMVLLFHLTDFAEPLPRTGPARRKEQFYTLSHLSSQEKRRRCQQMLDGVRQDFRVVTTTELLAAMQRKPLPEHKNSMKILLTGAAGFIGMHAAKALLARGDEVFGVDNLNDLLRRVS